MASLHAVTGFGFFAAYASVRMAGGEEATNPTLC